MKKLTKQQIGFIDDYLIKNKVKYWDVRIELIDHIANLLEEKLNNGIAFEDAVFEIHTDFGNRIGAWVLNKDKTKWIQSKTIYDDNKGFRLLILEKRKALKRKNLQFLKTTLKQLFKKPIFWVLYGLLFVVIWKFYAVITSGQIQRIVLYVSVTSMLYLAIRWLTHRKLYRSLIMEIFGAMLISIIMIFTQFSSLLLGKSNLFESIYGKLIIISSLFLVLPFIFSLLLFVKKTIKEQRKMFNQYIA